MPADSGTSNRDKMIRACPTILPVWLRKTLHMMAAMVNEATTRAPAYANHLSCCRVAPDERRSRTPSAVADPTIPTKASPHENWTTFQRLGPPMAYGFERRMTASSNGPVPKAATSTIPVMPMAEIHATGRHRREGRRPLGETTNTKGAGREIPGAKNHAPSQSRNTTHPQIA